MINNIIVKLIQWLTRVLSWDTMPSTDNQITEIPLIYEKETSVPTPPVDRIPVKVPESTLTASQRVYQVAKDNIGKHLTLNTSIPFELGCAEAVSWILLNASYAIPQGGIPTVTGLIQWMIKQGFVEEKKYAVGSIITGRNGTYAHIGICGKDWIMSNTSFTDTVKGLISGTFQANYRKDSWIKTYPQTRYFRPV